MNKQTYTLIIYAELPERNRLFFVPAEVADKYRSELNMAHGHYINESGWTKIKALSVVSSLVSEPPGDNSNIGPNPETDGKFLPFEVEVGILPIDKNVTRVVHTGFYL